MPNQYLIRREVPQVPSYEATQMAQGLGEAVARFLFPLLVELDTLLDKRLVRTFLGYGKDCFLGQPYKPLKQ